MPKQVVFDQTIGLLEQSLRLQGRSHELLVSNIANAETPGFTSRHLEFEAALNAAYGRDESERMQATHEDHFGLGARPDRGQGKVFAEFKRDPDGNSVQMEKEMARLSENQIKYEAATTMISRKFATLRYVIQEGSSV